MYISGKVKRIVDNVNAGRWTCQISQVTRGPLQSVENIYNIAVYYALATQGMAFVCWYSKHLKILTFKQWY